jgi:hypothetical protein
MVMEADRSNTKSYMFCWNSDMLPCGYGFRYDMNFTDNLELRLSLMS